jgi:hypothetical protein
MNLPLFVRPLADTELAALRHGLRSPIAFTVRRCQILLHSHQGWRPARIAAALGCTPQAVRDALRAFAQRGLDCLQPLPKTPQTIHAVWSPGHDDLRALLHQSPRKRPRSRLRAQMPGREPGGDRRAIDPGSVL